MRISNRHRGPADWSGHLSFVTVSTTVVLVKYGRADLTAFVVRIVNVLAQTVTITLTITAILIFYQRACFKENMRK